jgi:hypothetical protein
MYALRPLFAAVLMSAIVLLPGVAQQPSPKEAAAERTIRASGGSIHSAWEADVPRGTMVILSSAKATDEVAKVLKDVPNLTHLRLEDAALTEAGLAHLADCKSLHTLEINTRLLTPKHVQALARVKSLRRLIPRGDDLTDDQLEALAGLKDLESLMVSGDAVTAKGLKALGKLTKLRTLILDCPQLPDAALAELGGIENLEELQLVLPNVTEAKIGRLKELKKLRRLTLTCREMTNDDLKPMSQLKALDQLTLRHRRVTDAAVAELRKALPPNKEPRYQLDQEALRALRDAELPEEVLGKLVREMRFNPPPIYETPKDILMALGKSLPAAELDKHRDLILKHAAKPQERVAAEKCYFILEGHEAVIAPGDSEEQRLLKGRYNAARSQVKALMMQVNVGAQTPDILLDACQRLRTAATELDQRPASQIRVHEDCLELFHWADDVFQQRYREGKTNEADRQQVRYSLLDAELQLLRLKRQLEKPK